MPLIGRENLKLAIDKRVTIANDDLRRVYFAGLSAIIKGTPVGNPDLWVYKHPTRGYIDYVGYFGKPDYVGGRARSNWFLSQLTPSTKTTEATKRTKTPVLPKNVLDKKIYFTNNLPYINRLEYGYSQQAPNGWVRKALILMQNQIRALS